MLKFAPPRDFCFIFVACASLLHFGTRDVQPCSALLCSSQVVHIFFSSRVLVTQPEFLLTDSGWLFDFARR